jgi:hypothetical protein
MSSAAALSALSRSGLSLRVVAIALGTIGLAVVLAGLARHAVRRDRRLQLASAGLLSLAGVPIDLAGGASLGTALTTAAAWAAIFVASALVVRGAFARARAARRRVSWLDVAALSLAAAASLAFAVAHLAPQALATGFTLVAILVATRPTVKQLKPLGLALGGIAALAAFVMGCS